MIRTLFEFMLSRSLDDRREPKGWLARLMRSNAKLQQFDEQSRQLDQLLRASAAQQRQSLEATEDLSSVDAGVVSLQIERETTRQSRPKPPAAGYSARWLAGLAAAAVLLLAFSSSWLRSTAPEVHAGDFSQQLTVVPGEVLRLLTSVAKTSQTQIPQLSPLTNITLPELPAWEEVAINVEAPVRLELDNWQESWQKFKSQLPPPTLEL